MREIHVDGGAFIEPPDYIFRNAYFSVVNEQGTLIHSDKSLGDVYSGVAEYEAIKWAAKNIKERPLKIYSDCITAIAWVRKGAHTKKHHLPPIDLTGIIVEYKKKNLADQYNEKYISPKYDPSYYYKRWVAKGRI